MHDLAVEQIGHGGKPDMRVRADVEAVAGAELRRTEMIEEDEGADHARARKATRGGRRNRRDRRVRGTITWQIASH